MSTWQEGVRKCAEAHDWTEAMRIVDREVARTPQDMDVRAWRARILLWSGKLGEAEREFKDILAAVPNDPDNWMGLASLYSRESRPREALQALDRAVELDAKRADLRAARAAALRALGNREEARLEFHRALDLDPANAEGRAGIISLRDGTRHILRVAVNTDWFDFAHANQNEGLTMTSEWTPHWSTTFAAEGYRWGGLDAAKFTASGTGRLPARGALTVGGAAAHDNGVIPKEEAFVTYDQGFKLRGTGPIRGLEILYGQHWYWYTTARILTTTETMLLYLPRDWTWSLGLIQARSHFSGNDAAWQPSGLTRLGFPITRWEERRLGGTAFFAVGTENFAQVNQIREFSSQTYGGGLRLQMTALQDVSGFAAYQRRSHDRNECSFGLSYGIRF